MLLLAVYAPEYGGSCAPKRYILLLIVLYAVIEEIPTKGNCEICSSPNTGGGLSPYNAVISASVNALL
jgi:hypothetical protein